MNIRSRSIWVGLMVPLAVAMAVGTSAASSQTPVRPFKAQYRGSFAMVTRSPSEVGPPGPAEIRAQELQMTGQGWAMTLGPSHLSGALAVGQGGPCQPMSGWVVLSSTSPTDAIPVSVRLSLSGLLCTPLEGTAKSISGHYQAAGSPQLGLGGGSGQFAGRADGNSGGRLVLDFKGSI